MENQLLDSIAQKAKTGYFFFEDKYYALLDKINQQVPIYKVIDPIDKVVPSFILFIGIIALLAIFFIFLSFASVSYLATIQVVDNKGNSLEGVAIEIKIGGQTRQFSTDDWGEAKVDIPKQELEAEAKFTKQDFNDLNKLVMLYANESSSVTMQPESVIILQPTDKTIRVVDSETNRLITQEVRLTFACSNGVAAPLFQEGSTGEFEATQPSNCIDFTATAQSDGYEAKSKKLSSEINYILLSRNVSGTTGKIMAIIKDSAGNPVPDTIVRAVDETRNLSAASSSTSLSGTAMLEELQPGNYTVSASASGGRTGQETGVAVNAGETKNVLITLPDADDPSIKKIFLKIVEQGTSNAVASAQAFIYDVNKLIDSTTSDSKGIVEKKLTAAKATYLVVLTHPDFVTKIDPSVPVKRLSDATPLIVLMARSKFEQPNATSGKIIVKVVDEAQKPVKNAAVSIYDEKYPNIPLKSPAGRTLEDGTYTFTNLAPGTYFAKAVDSTGKAEGVSDKNALAAGETMYLETILVLGKGTIKATVFDAESAGGNEKIPNAAVEFLDARYPTIVLATCTTAATGECTSEPIPADKFVTVKASATGFIAGYANSVIDIVNKSTGSAQIGLVHESSYSGVKFDTVFAAICEDKACKTEASKVVSDPSGTKKYYAKLNLIFGEDTEYKGTVQHIRAGIDSAADLAAQGYKIKITNVSSALLSSSAILSSCWSNDKDNPFVNPDNCKAQADAKQANIYYPDLSGKQIIPIIIEFAVEKELADGEKLELKARAKTTAGTENILTAEKLKVLFINQAMCQNNAFVWSFELKKSDSSKTPLDTAPDAMNSLAMNDVSIILYNVYNCSGRAYPNAKISAKNDPIAAGAISFTTTAPFDYGPKTIKENFSFAADTQTSGEQPIFAALETPSIALEFTVSAGNISSAKSIFFSIEGNGRLKVDCPMQILSPAGEPTLWCNVSDNSTGQAIGGAHATLFIGGIQRDADTGASGDFEIPQIQGLQGLSSVKLVVRKAGYKTFEKQIPVGYGQIAVNPGIDCISISKTGQTVNEVAIYFQKSATTATDFFTVKNECDGSVAIKIESELKASPSAEFTLAPSETKTVTVSAETIPGTFPLYIGEYGVNIMARPAGQDVSAGYVGPLQIARVYVTDPNSCFRLADPAAPTDTGKMKSSFDIKSGSSEGLIVNKCFAYFEDLSMPSLEKVHDYMPAEDVFSLVFKPPTQAPVTKTKQAIFEPTADNFSDQCPFTDIPCKIINLIDSGGYVFLNWIDFFMTDEDHSGGDRHRVWAQTSKNVWSNITAELPYTASQAAKGVSCETLCKESCGSGAGSWIEKCRNSCLETCTESPSLALFPVIDNLGLVDTDTYYPKYSNYSDELTTQPMWQGQHNVCNNNVGTFEGDFSACSVKDYFRGMQTTPYYIGHITNKIALEIDGGKTKISAVRYNYTSYDKDHLGQIDFRVKNNTLMGDAYSIIEVEDTTGVSLAGPSATEIRVNWSISKTGVLVKENSNALLNEPSGIAIPKGSVLFISVNGYKALKSSFSDFSYAEFKPAAPMEVKSIDYTSHKNSQEFQRPQGQDSPSLKLYTYANGAWRAPIIFDVENPGETDYFNFDPITDVEVIALENNSDDETIAKSLVINYITRQSDAVPIGSGTAIIPAGQPSFEFTPSINDTGVLPGYSSIEYLVEDTTPETIVYFSATKSASSPALGKVTALTSTPGEASTTQTERFHIRLVGQSQGQCMLGGLKGSTGPGSMPRVLFDWGWDSIDMNSCSVEDSNFIYCDPTQFTVSLVKRLEKIRELAEEDVIAHRYEIESLKKFSVYLIEDAYTSDFRADFADFFGRQFLQDELANAAHPWKEYLLDDERLVFDTANAKLSTDPENGAESKIVSAGQHEISIYLEFDEDQYDFFYNQETIAHIKVYISKLADPVIKNPFYYLPFNGDLGFNEATGRFERDDYGLVFTNIDEPLDIVASSAGKGYYSTASPSGSTGEKQVTTSQVSTFEGVNIDNRGMIMKISQAHDSIEFLPSIATPILLQMQPDAGKVESYYWIRDDDAVTHVSGANFMNTWSAAGSGMRNDSGICLDYAGMQLNYRVLDSSNASGTCAAAIEGSYGFNYGTVGADVLDKRLFFETVFYVPEKMVITLKKSCNDKSVFYSPEESINTTNYGIPMGKNALARRAETMENLVKLVSQEYVCISSDSENFSFWWNPQKILSDLQPVKENIQTDWDTSIKCASPLGTS